MKNFQIYDNGPPADPEPVHGFYDIGNQFRFPKLMNILPVMLQVA